MIEFRQVHKSLGGKPVLRGLDFVVQPQEIVFILGRSGSGKSVMLRHVVGLLKADQGQVLWKGQDTSLLGREDLRHLRRRCSLIFQLPSLLDARSLWENLGIGIRHLPAKERWERISKALAQVGLAKLAPSLMDRFPWQLSYGEQKRVAIARALTLEPEQLLFDEPTTGLDPENSQALHALIKNLARHEGKGCLVVSHDLRNALSTADRILMMENGQLVDAGTPDEIRRSQVPHTRDFMADLREAP